VIIDLPYFLLALLILWFPRSWLRFGRAATRRWRWLRRSRRRLAERMRTREPGEVRLTAAEEFGKPRNYIDFLRAFAGGLLVVGHADWAIVASLRPDPAAALADAAATGAGVDYLRMGLLLVGVMIQFLRYEGRLTFYAPIFYLGGLGFALCGVDAGLFAFIVGWTVNTAAPLLPGGFLSLYALLVFMLGLLFRGLGDSYVVFMGAVSFLPVLVSLLARRSLAIFVKRIK
jgi:hypothetical protein